MKSDKGRKYMLWLPVTAAAFMLLGLWAGRFLATDGSDAPARTKLDKVFELIGENYVDPVSYDSLVELAIPEILLNLDPHSVYIPASERTAANRDLESSFFGIGIQFQMINDTLYIVEVIAGGAAEEAGIMPGDRIIAVDSLDIAGNGTSSNEVFGLLRGPRDTRVHVTVRRQSSAEPLEFDLVRAEVPVSPIDAAYMLTDTIGYVRLGKFSDNTFAEFLRVFDGLRSEGARAYVLDLRGNGGGYMSPAVLMANEFFGDDCNLIVSTRGRNLSDNRVIYSDRTGAFGSEPVAVLIDEFTASASEILSGALQDNDRAIIIGRRSFGKGLVQTPFELPDSSEFRLTIQRYYTPSGRCIQKTYSNGMEDYQYEVYNRFSNGELFTADSIHIDSTQIFHTSGGRQVYGGGGIMPDVFVPSDTAGVTSYYIKVANSGLLRDFAYEYADRNRSTLAESRNTAELLRQLPQDYTLLQAFVEFARRKGVAPRWYYINTSAPLIVNQIKALIARDVVGMDGYFEVVNSTDPVVIEAVERIQHGDARTLPGIDNNQKR